MLTEEYNTVHSSLTSWCVFSESVSVAVNVSVYIYYLYGLRVHIGCFLPLRSWMSNCCHVLLSTLITRFMGPTLGPSGADRTQREGCVCVAAHVGLMNLLAIWVYIWVNFSWVWSLLYLIPFGASFYCGSYDYYCDIYAHGHSFWSTDLDFLKLSHVGSPIVLLPR